jgi:hypothetical protein
MKFIAVAAVALIAAATFAQSSDDEKVNRKLEQEWPTHVGSSQADIDFQKSIMADKFITVDNVGHITHSRRRISRQLPKPTPM